MSTLSLIYKEKDKNDTNITTRKTYLLGVNELYVEPGYNVREIDQQHVEEFRDAFIAGEHVPPLTVQVTEQGVKIIDGHHRYHGAKLAQEAGYEIRLECKDFTGSEADRIAFMVTSSQGRALEPLERAAAYQRLINQGWEPAEIAKKVKRSPSDIDQHLALLTVGDDLIEMVKAGEVAATTAVAMVREHGAKAETVAKTQLAKAKAGGKKRLTRSAAMPQFSAAKLRQLIELIAKNCEAELSDDTAAISLDFESGLQALEVMQIISEAKAHFGIGAAADDFGMHETKLPLAADEITEQSGVEVLACAVAAFGEKETYTHAESKYAHTWAADSVAQPEFFVIPAETIAKAVAYIRNHRTRDAIQDWAAEKYQGAPDLGEIVARYATVADETGLPLDEVLPLLNSIDLNHGRNIRELRHAFGKQLEQQDASHTEEGA